MGAIQVNVVMHKEEEPVNKGVSNRRLLELAEFLEALPRKRFDYTYWVGTDWKGAPDLSCGTTACALGWAATMPVFQKLGLRLVQPPRNSWLKTGWVECSKTGSEGEGAAVEIFGLTWSEAEYIFNPDTDFYGHKDWPLSPESSATPKRVAKHIRRFVERRPSIRD